MLPFLFALTAWAAPIPDCPRAPGDDQAAAPGCAPRPPWWHEGTWSQAGVFIGIGPGFASGVTPVVFALSAEVERGWRRTGLRGRVGAIGGGSTIVPFAYGGEVGLSVLRHLPVADAPWWIYPTYRWDRSHVVGVDASIGRLFNETRATWGIVGAVSFLHLQLRANASLLYTNGRRGDWTELVGPAVGGQVTLSFGVQTRRPHTR